MYTKYIYILKINLKHKLLKKAYENISLPMTKLKLYL